MAISGIDAVIFGVSDLSECRRFLDDWGGRPLDVSPDGLVYETKDGSEVIVRPLDAVDLPPAIESGNTVREVVWGVESEDDLKRLRSEFSGKSPELQELKEGFRIQDPNGLSVAFRLTRRRPYKAEPTPINAPGAHSRVDRRSPVYERAAPIQIGHVVAFAANYDEMRRFYTERLGFIISDEYPGHGVFMRCRVVGEHHNLFLLSRPGRPGINHVAFTVSDIHEVIGGGIAMSKKGWKTEIGPGRHPISSAYFWYFENPLCAPLEYYADDDFCTEAWRAGTFERRPELFAEWAITGGIDGGTRRQVHAKENDTRGHP